MSGKSSQPLGVLRQCANCRTPMLRVPYMKTPHSRRVWLDRCAECRAVWFDAGEAEATADRDVHLSLTAHETESACPVCQLPLVEATLAHAHAKACPRCRGVHLPAASLPAVSFDDHTEEQTLKPPALFECAVCARTFSLDQGDGVTCRPCSPRPHITGENVVHESPELSERVGLSSLLDLFF